MAQIRLLWLRSATRSPAADGLPLPTCGPFAVQVATSTREALECAAAEPFDVAVLELPFPEAAVETCLATLRRCDPDLPVLIRHATATPAEAVAWGRAGVFQLLGEGAEATRQIRDAAEFHRTRGLAKMAAAVERAPWEHLMVGESPGMRQIIHIVRLVGPRRATALITGETGTGKELVARALHLAGPRSRGPFVAVNCTALPDNLLEAELFGHVKGAFTGAVHHRIGRFEQAHGGTLFLDEIGDLPLELQAKLLRVLQEREFQRLGSSETVRVDMRVVAATNCDLTRKIQAGRFREDLYYRLNVVPIEMPPLRRRPGDIPLLAEHFVAKVCAAENLPRKTLASEALEYLSAYTWPGNVRQLENLIEMAVVLSGDRTVLGPADLPLPLDVSGGLHPQHPLPVIAVPDSGLDFERTLTEIERSIVEQALRKTGGNKKAAADMLRLKRTTLSAKVRSLEAASACN